LQLGLSLPVQCIADNGALRSLCYGRATVRIPNIGETNIEPIKNPVTGEEHRARIVLPDGFEYKEAEMG
jgi:hypothetical protein